MLGMTRGLTVRTLGIKVLLGIILGAVGLCIGAAAWYFIAGFVVTHTVKPQDVSVGEGLMVIGGTYVCGICGAALGAVAGLTFPMNANKGNRVLPNLLTR